MPQDVKDDIHARVGMAKNTICFKTHCFLYCLYPICPSGSEDEYWGGGAKSIALTLKNICPQSLLLKVPLGVSGSLNSIPFGTLFQALIFLNINGTV